MAWNGYFVYEGTEIINVARTEAYMKTACLAPWFRPVFEAEGLGPLLGVAEYVTPEIDNAPWVDPDIAESSGFYGMYPINITGIEDSTRTATVTQSTKDGGAVGNLRFATREAVFSGVIIADSLSAAEYGFRWLKVALRGDPCNPQNNIGGGELRYLVDEPAPYEAVLDGGSITATGSIFLDAGAPGTDPIDGIFDGGRPGDEASAMVFPYEEPWSLDTGLDPLEAKTRRLRKVTITGGPSITGKRVTTNDMHLWQVQFTATAADPYEYSLPRLVFDDFGPTLTPVIAPGVEFFPASTSAYNTYTDVVCPTPIWTPIYDPACPPLLAPPAPPDVALGCWDAPDAWKRWWITTPEAQVPRWDVVTPVLHIYAAESDIRGLRVRFYPDEDVSPAASIATCGWDFDLLVTYLPEGFRLVIDASAQIIQATDSDGIVRAAGSLVTGSDGKPFTWPSMSCDRPYVVVFDLATRAGVTPPRPITGMSLVTKVAA